MSPRRVLTWLLLSSLISIAWGYWIEYVTDNDSLDDFRAVYFGARTVIDHHDPYNTAEFLQVYSQHGGAIPTDPDRRHAFNRAVAVCVNLPSTLLIVAPFALLGWGPAHFLWMILLPASLVLAGWLLWDIAGPRGPTFTLVLLCIVLANCELVLLLGNASGVAVSLCVVAVWCFIRKKHEFLGILCFAAGLVLKPQEIGFVWLYFLLAGGEYRKRALQSLGVTFSIALLSVAWMSSVSPHWIQEWHSNIASTTAHGDLNNPGPTSIGNVRLGSIVSLQAVISFFWDDPHIYGPATYLLIGSLIAVWVVVTLRSSVSKQGTWLAIASISALGLLPVYHRQYDVKLLLLTIPAAVVLWVEGSAFRKAALVVTTIGIVLTADIPLATLVTFNKGLHLPQDQIIGKVVSILLARTATLALVLVGTFYLWAYVRYAWRQTAEVPNEAEPNLAFGASSV